MVRNKAAGVDYLCKKISVLALTVTKLLTIKVETLTANCPYRFQNGAQ